MSENGRTPLAPAPGPRRPPSPLEHPAGRFPEPPAFRAHPLSPARQCANCAGALRSDFSSARCWGCGRALCADCYWRHGTAPSTHRCTSCLAHGVVGATTISGGHAGAHPTLSGSAPRPAH